MKRCVSYSVGVIFVTVLLVLYPANVAAQVQLRVNSEVTVHDRDVHLTDLVTGAEGSERLSKLLRSLDIVKISDEETSTTISRRLLEIRLMLAGLREDDFRINGPEQIDVTYVEPLSLTDSDIEAAATNTMATVLGTDPEDLRVRLNQPFMQSLPSGIHKLAGLRVEVTAPARSGPGQTSLTVRLWNGRNLAVTRSGRFDVLKRHRVAVSRVSLQRDMTIDENDVQFENRFLPTSADEPQEADIYGQRVVTSVRAGQLLTLRDVARPVPQAKAIVVKARDKVRVTAISGPLRIQLRQAEAMEAGRVGDRISLRNLESRQTITGRVTGTGTVEIQLR